MVAERIAKIDRWVWITIGSGVAALLFLGAIVHNELRMRYFVDYPWLNDRDAVLNSIDDLRQRVEALEADQH